MSKTDQFKKNLALNERLASFALENPDEFSKIPSNASVVVYSSKDEELNKSNDIIFNNLSQKGETVVKAKETEDKDKSFELTLG